jgi:hypothetical protein
MGLKVVMLAELSLPESATPLLDWMEEQKTKEADPFGPSKRRIQLEDD